MEINSWLIPKLKKKKVIRPWEGKKDSRSGASQEQKQITQNPKSKAVDSGCGF